MLNLPEPDYSAIAAMDPQRKKNRREYWRNKYIKPEWGHDIHFALFPTKRINKDGFISGLKINTTQTAQDIQEQASLYRLATGVRILDYGCGSGDLLRKLAATLPKMQGLGIDISDTAIDYATEQSMSKAPCLEFRVGDISALHNLVGEFDIIVCRDMYYTLDIEEQGILLRKCAELLRPGGILYVADLAIEAESVSTVRGPLLDRQFAGEPITWSPDSSNTRQWSIVEQAKQAGFVLFKQEIEDNAVADSYKAACDLADPATKSAFEALSDLARRQVHSHTCVPYVRLFFSREWPYELQGDSIGVGLDRPLLMGEKVLLQPGSWSLPVGQWSLVLGRSGVGKTTLLNILSGFVRLSGVKRLGAINATTYLLDQRPVLIEELSVDDNILLFARSKADADAVMEALGFDHSLRLRTANSRLSGGEWQRVALGQAIAAHPEILYLDEPGTGIDRVRKYQLFSMIKENLSQTADGKRTTVICVDHEFLQIESFFSYIFEMLHGRLVCVQH